MSIEVPDEIAKAARPTEKSCLVELAVQLYAQGRLRPRPARELCGLSRLEFEKELAARQISLNTVEDLGSVVATLEELGIG
jgi:predicted HTH domain antitoxin